MSALTTSDIDVVYPESDGKFEAYLKKDEARRPAIEKLEQLLAEAKQQTKALRTQLDAEFGLVNRLAAKLRELRIDPDGVCSP